MRTYLHEALAAETIDAELRAGACTIVRALITGGPARDINDYDHGPPAVEHLLRHLEGTTDPNELAAAGTIARWRSDNASAGRKSSVSAPSTGAPAHWSMPATHSIGEEARRAQMTPRAA